MAAFVSVTRAYIFEDIHILLTTTEILFVLSEIKPGYELKNN